MSVINSPFRYPGGKFYARKIILSYLPQHNCYIEPFCGGSSIFFAKNRVQQNLLNDIDDDLINCLIHIRDNPTGIADILKGVEATKENHAYYKKEYKPKNDLERAARWFFLNRTSYSGIMKEQNCYFGYGDKYSMRPENWRKHLLRTSKKLKNVTITNKDFKSVINDAPDNSFIFLDPPYLNRDQDKFYTHSFCLDDHNRLMESLKRNSHRIRFLLTYDYDDTIKQMYSWAKIEVEGWNYMIYRTDDQTKEKNGQNKKHNGKRYKGQEFLILNYNLPSEKQIKLDQY